MNDYGLLVEIENTDKILADLEDDMREQGVEEETLTLYANYALLQVAQLLKFDDVGIDEFIEKTREKLQGENSMKLVTTKKLLNLCKKSCAIQFGYMVMVNFSYQVTLLANGYLLT